MVRTTATMLKAKLGRYMAVVRGGRAVEITDRGRPVARLVPVEDGPRPTLTISPPAPGAPPLARLRFARTATPGPSVVALLREDRDRR